MAENLNYKEGGKCYAEGVDGVSADSIANNCKTYGRLYDWAAAMNLPADCNSNTCSSQINTKHQGICPSGWHISSDEDWNVLMNFINPNCSSLFGGNCIAGNYLKATSGWDDYVNTSGNGEDTYGFSALPGGYRDFITDNYYNVGTDGCWWSAREYASSSAPYRNMRHGNGIVEWNVKSKSSLYSVRCLQD